MYTTHSRDGLEIAYDVVGDGPPLVMVHPSLSNSRIWWDLGYVAALSRVYRLILIDARGHGQSGKPGRDEDYALPAFVEDIVAVLDAERIDRAHYLGYSLGGRVAFGCGVFAPERFRSLVIGAGTFDTQIGAFDRVSYPGALETIAVRGVEEFLNRWEVHAQYTLPESVKQMFRQNDVQAMVPYLRQMEREPDLSAYLPTIDHPALLFVGELDQDRLPAAKTASALMPRADLAIIPDASHLSALLQTQMILDLAQPFLERTSHVEVG
jgi:pimeloyl-ACP methyl ester carboxylesterase